MTQVTIRRRIIISFGVILAVMVTMAGVAAFHLLRIGRETHSVRTDSLPGLYYNAALLEAWSNDFVIAERRVLERDRAARATLDGRLQASGAVLDQAAANYETTVFDPQDRALFDTFKRARSSYADVKDAVIRESDAAKSDSVLPSLDARLLPEFERGSAAIKALVDFNRAGTDASAAQIEASVSADEIGAAASFMVALGLALILGVTLFRAITYPLTALTDAVDAMRTGDFTQRLSIPGGTEFSTLADGFNRMTADLTGLVRDVQLSSTQVGTSVAEIATSAKEQQATASEIAATTTEIGATSREISATSKELVKTMNDVATVADQSAALAGTGHTGLTHMEEAMRHVMEAAGSVNAKLATLNEKAGDIGQVVTTIAKVADQTNLLSLNAAIEAEKAGEYGRGFAVVATEIRRLADQTAVATHDIDQLIKAMQSSVSVGVMSMDKFSEEVRRGMQAVQDVSGVLAQVIQRVQTLAPRFDAVTEGMQAQATGAEQITEALAQLSDAARQTVESIRQSNVAIDGLNQVTASLRGGVGRFTLKVA